MKIDCIWPLEAQVGESPVWIAEEAAFYFVDIYGDAVHRYHPQSGARRTWSIPGRVSALVPRISGGFVASDRHTIGELDLEGGRVVPWLTVDEPETHRLNDAKCDAFGRYWTGSMDETKKAATGSLYLLDEQRRIRAVDHGYTVSNGPTFSLDGRRMYHADTTAHVLYVLELALDGTPTSKRPFVEFAPEDGRPDGMTTDTDDCIWVCHAGGSRVTRFTPDGRVDRVIPMPVSKVTSCAFGGPDHRSLLITTARIGLDQATLAKEPLAGGVFVTTPGVQGLPPARYAG
jgi:sugar lactone lactonase YvrE